MTEYQKIADKFRKLGDYSLLALSKLAHIVPSDGIKYIEKRTGVSATAQMEDSSIFEAMEGTALALYGIMTVNPIAAVGGSFMALEAVVSRGVFKDEPSASLVVEVPYQIGKAIYNRAKTRYLKVRPQ